MDVFIKIALILAMDSSFEAMAGDSNFIAAFVVLQRNKMSQAAQLQVSLEATVGEYQNLQKGKKHS